MTNPYLITGPALISFSGGRTSGYMLDHIVRAHSGKLPDDVVVAFANTGKEREETLRYVHECSVRFGVKIHWLEWRAGGGIYEEVGYNSASRNGEPFKALIAQKQRLPNWQERWCTTYLKLLPLFALAKTYGWVAGNYNEVIGLRYDEGHRIIKGMANAEKAGRTCLYPLSRARVRKLDVMRYWLGDNTDPKNLTHPLPQGFDLGLRDYEGNCDFCFLKGRGLRKRIAREQPAAPMWWHEMEVEQEGFFSSRDRVIDLVNEVRRSPDLFDDPPDEEYDVECGLHCGPEDEPATMEK